MKKELFYPILLIIPILLLLSFPAWSVPGLINYQGKLTDPNGTSLNGAYTMKFYLYNAESNGSPLWNEQQDVTVTNGIYNVELGKISSFPSDLFDNENLYLEVEIFSTGMDWETLFPRQRLTSTPFAMKAGDADTVDGYHGSELEESEEINNKIALHVQDASAHHLKTTSFTDLTDTATDDQIPDDITVNHAKDADKVDGKHASEFGDGHSLDAADGNPTNVVYVNNEGNVGIGTTAPTGKLHVKIEIFNLFKVGSGVVVGEPTGGDRGIGTINAKNIYSAGNVGIGTTNPEAGLQIAYNDVTRAALAVSQNGSGDLVNFALNNDYDGQSKFIIKNSGNVGIGTTNPAEKLHVYGTDMAIVEIESGNDYPAQLYLKGDGVKWAMSKRRGPENDRLGFYYHDGASWSPGLLTLETSGNVGIGTESPQQKMHISGVMRLEPQSSPPSGALGDLYVGTDGNLYFHNGTEWKEVSLI